MVPGVFGYGTKGGGLFLRGGRGNISFQLMLTLRAGCRAQGWLLLRCMFPRDASNLK